jgi:peptidoglycan/LPS O-acetylase OafA/YrhL
MRLVSLDVLRSVAILLVIGRHIGPVEGWHPFARAFMEIWGLGGWVGVDLFFVLSGFLVSGLLFREYLCYRTVSVGRFLVRRGLKIYPAFYVFLGATILFRYLRHDVLPIPNIVSEALFVQNYFPYLWGHTWSLAVEEHFYLLCAMVIAILTLRANGREDPYRSIPWIFLTVAVLSLGARIVNAILRAEYRDGTHLFATHLRLDSLMFGVFLSYLYHFRRAFLETLVHGRETFLLVLGAALLAPAFIFRVETTFLVHTVGLTVFYLGSGLLVVVLVLRGLPDRPWVRCAAFLGSYSYSIYLWHLMGRSELGMILWQRLRLPPMSPLGVSAYILGSIAAGIAMAKIVEVPVLRVRDRLFPSRSVPLHR